MLLGAIAVAFMMPAAADAARRDERGRQQISRPAAQVVKASPAAKPAQLRQAAAPAVRQPAARGRAEARASSRNMVVANGRAVAPGRSVATRRAVMPGPRFANLQPGDMRSRGYSLVMRNAAAATMPRQTAASCSRRNGRIVCASRDTDGVAGWQAGLPPVDYAQRDCPAGTFATLARGHEDVVRCMPI
jgi:hypothetical protein